MIALVSVASDVDRMHPVRDDPATALSIIERLLGVEVVSCAIADHTIAPDDYIVDFGGGYQFPVESQIGDGVATVGQAGVGFLAANMNWQDYDTPLEPDSTADLVLTDVPDWDARVMITRDQYEVVHTTRPFTTEENAAADERAALLAAEEGRDQNRMTLREQLEAAIADNNVYKTYVTGIPAPDRTPEQRFLLRVTKELNGILRWMSGEVDDISDAL